MSDQIDPVLTNGGAHSEFDTSNQEIGRLEELLLEAEQRAASIPQLELRVAQLERELSVARAEAHEARGETRRLDQRLMESQQILVDVMRSPSWQVTKPLRRAKHLLRDVRQ